MNRKDQLQHYKQGLGKINQEDYTYVDTKQLQIRSVIEFLDVLGYDFYQAFNSTFGARYGAGFKGCEIISFNSAVNLHDSIWCQTPQEGYLSPHFGFVKKMDGGYYDRTFWLDAYTFNQAQAAKLVNRVYIHCTKHGLLKAYKQQVSFVDSRYEQLFLQPLIEKETKICKTLADNVHTLYEN